MYSKGRAAKNLDELSSNWKMQPNHCSAFFYNLEERTNFRISFAQLGDFGARVQIVEMRHIPVQMRHTDLTDYRHRRDGLNSELKPGSVEAEANHWCVHSRSIQWAISYDSRKQEGCPKQERYEQPLIVLFTCKFRYSKIVPCWFKTGGWPCRNKSNDSILLFGSSRLRIRTLFTLSNRVGGSSVMEVSWIISRNL